MDNIKRFANTKELANERENFAFPSIYIEQDISYTISCDGEWFYVTKEGINVQDSLYSLKLNAGGGINELVYNNINYEFVDNNKHKYIYKYNRNNNSQELLFTDKKAPQMFHYRQQNNKENIYVMRYAMPKSQVVEHFLPHIHYYNPLAYDMFIKNGYYKKHLYYLKVSSDFYKRVLFVLPNNKNVFSPNSLYEREYFNEIFSEAGVNTEVPDDLITYYLNQDEHVKKLELLCNQYRNDIK